MLGLSSPNSVAESQDDEGVIVVCYFFQYPRCSWVDPVIGTQFHLREDSQTCLRQVRIDLMVIEKEYLGTVSEIVVELCMKKKETA